LTPRFSDEELAVIEAAARAAGATTTGFCADAVLLVARGEFVPGQAGLREALRQLGLEVAAARTAVNRFGTNVNQVAAAWNSTGEVPPYARAAIELCTRAVGRLDEVAGQLSRRLR
jgi:hypothetical protein